MPKSDNTLDNLHVMSVFHMSYAGVQSKNSVIMIHIVQENEYVQATLLLAVLVLTFPDMP